jgi:hypothetical protein
MRATLILQLILTYHIAIGEQEGLKLIAAEFAAMAELFICQSERRLLSDTTPQ